MLHFFGEWIAGWVEGTPTKMGYYIQKSIPNHTCGVDSERTLHCAYIHKPLIFLGPVLLLLNVTEYQKIKL